MQGMQNEVRNWLLRGRIFIFHAQHRHHHLNREAGAFSVQLENLFGEKLCHFHALK